MISKNDDLNDYINPGTYFSANASTSNTLKNCPFTTSGFMMTVYYSTGNDPAYITQEIHTANKTYTRSMSNNVFSDEWNYFSDDATVLAHVISPVTMNDTVDINTGYVDLNFPLNEYFFFKFVCAAGNNSSVGNLYEENVMVGFSYYVPCGQGYIRFNIESFIRINILENTSGYNFRYIKALKK